MKSRLLFFLFVALVSSALIHRAAGATIGHHPGFVPLHGYGIDLRNPDDLKPPVASLDFAQPEIYAGDGSAQFSVHFSQHKLDLARHFALNSSLSVKSMAFNGRANFNYVDNTRYSGNDLNFAFVCTRDYGTTTYTNASVGPQFSEEVNLFRQTNLLSGPALAGAISSRFGTHYIKGHRSVGKVVVIYTFHFDSTTTTRDLKASLDARYRGGVTTVNFHTDVRSFFEQTASRVSMTYQFYSSDPGRPLLFSTNAITSYADFLAFSDAVVNYCNTQMTPPGGERSEFVVDRIENLRGYCALAGNCVPAPLSSADYDRWMDAYGRLARWDDALTGWAIDPRGMSWMNTNGQRMVLGMRRDVTNYRRTLEATARRHFDTGEPLVVPEEIFNYFANFSRIPLPTINIIATQSTFMCDAFEVIGYINCGTLEQTRTNPFLAIVTFKDETETAVGTDNNLALYYDKGQFEQFVRSGFPGCESHADWRRAFLDTPTWQGLGTGSEHLRLAYFKLLVANSQRSQWTIGVKDSAGGLVDVVQMETLRTASPYADGFAVGNESDLTLEIEVAQTGVVDDKTTTKVLVTNNGVGAAFGAYAILPIPSGMQPLAASGSQGQLVTTNGVLVLTNGAVLYEVGPLAYGSTANIRLDLVPLRAGILTAAAPVSVTVGDGLTDPDLSNNSVFSAPITVFAPLLESARNPGHIEFSWVSETGRLNLQSATTLSASPVWSSVTNVPTLAGSTRTLRLPATGSRKFFRLQMPHL